ncbi:UDP-N-acetylmuramoyl-L-alanyl-D-glutamate--2,6-diaminopimelate ligase [bacterium]|nr:UDP-N-acetylmuramoyl-L-alanyl-D-glutamate--2,6-diaminopimelate ligase [bacterium]
MKLLSQIIGSEAVVPSDMTSIAIESICIDSRKVQPGSLFIAIPGFESDGHDYINQAALRGAVAVLAQRSDSTADVPVMVVEDTRAMLPHIAAHFFDNPADQLRIIGITGTNGKTTVVTLLEAIYRAHGEKTGQIGTLGYRWSDCSLSGARTTPDGVELHEIFSLMLNDGVEIVFMEVSSHAVKLHRTDGLNFDGAIFTNFTRDHMDFHQNEADYLDSKLGLFRQLNDTAISVINGSDAKADSFRVNSPGKCLSFGFCAGFDAVIESFEHVQNGCNFILSYKQDTYKFFTPLWGRFNIENTAAAVLYALADGLDSVTIQRGLKMVERVPGRMDGFMAEQGFRVIIDYAHTPDALENVIKTIGDMTSGRVITVFGCGGDRDKGKRPLMGRIAEKGSDIVIVTTDNPRSESPDLIIKEILAGIINPEKAIVIQDRKEAIESALSEIYEGDTLLIAGKGHERYQEINGVRHQFDDLEIAKNWTEIRT